VIDVVIHICGVENKNDIPSKYGSLSESIGCKGTRYLKNPRNNSSYINENGIIVLLIKKERAGKVQRS
jgi:hypothetical protein